VVSAAGDATALAALTTQRFAPTGGALLLATGTGQGEALAADLRKHGFKVLRRTAYGARPAAELPPAAVTALMAGSLRAVLFFSTATARVFVELLIGAGHSGTIAEVAAIGISQSCANILRRLSWGDVRVAAHPTQEDLLAQLR
jgi:uroporphyrinogen-III synthase